MKQFKGRPVVAGTCTANALVSHGGFNTLASFQKSLQFGDKTAKCGDQNNKDLFGKPMVGTALCLPQTIGSTTGGMVLYCAKAMERNPACCLRSILTPLQPQARFLQQYGLTTRCLLSITSAKSSSAMLRTE